jgi:quercetin dioxygenase-like cupin family protein
MPVLNKRIIVAGSGDSMELLETSAMTNGARVRARINFGAAGAHVAAHIHPLQEETYEVISGTLAYVLNGTKHTAPAGATVRLPRGVPHEHYSEGPGETLTIMTMTPGLDFDYALETVFGLASEGRLESVSYGVQGLVMIRKMKGAFMLASMPVWFQKLIAWIITPFAYRLGYRAVYQRFSGEEW